MFVIAIDPGLTGALAVLDAKGWLAAVHDTPTLCLRVSRGRAEALLLAEYGRRQGHQGIANAPGDPPDGPPAADEALEVRGWWVLLHRERARRLLL